MPKWLQLAPAAESVVAQQRRNRLIPLRIKSLPSASAGQPPKPASRGTTFRKKFAFQDFNRTVWNRLLGFALRKGKLLRLGKDWWTTFTTGADLEIGGKPLAAGSYLLALSCDADGKFALAVLDAAKGMKGGALPWPDRSGKRNWEPDLLIPLEHSKDAANSSDKLTIALLANGEDLQNGKLQLHWGPHQLTAKLAVHAGKK